VEEYDNRRINIMAETKSNEKFAFEEYKLFYESTEKVTNRCLVANRWNYSICTAILVAIAVILNWGFLNQTT
jgi:hypothetical protein